MNHIRIEQQIQFIVEIDKLKSVFRKSLLMDRSRHENDAEHSWHLSVLAVILLEHANESNLDLLKIMKMLIIHDIVEIDAGDTFVYDEQGYEDKAERELNAANRLYGLLPDDQKEELIKLWQEFEKRETPEAKFAAALDRLHPILHNFYTEGASWQKYGITSKMVFEKNKHIAEGSLELWDFVQKLIQTAVDRGFLNP